jgi:Bacterial Ig-like domain (group 3)
MAEDSTGVSQIVITQITATSTTLSSRPNPSVSGDKVTYTALVRPTPDSGTVAFAEGAAPIPGCEAQPVDAATGEATCLVTYSAPAAHTITAAYSGDDAFIASTSSPLIQHVEPAPPSPSSSGVPTRLQVRVPGVSVFGHAGKLTRCRMSEGRLRSCTVRLVHSGRLLAVGRARSAETRALTVRLRLSAYGRRILARRLGGISVRVRAVASTSGGVQRASERTRAVLRVERLRTPPGSFVANRPLLTPRGKRFLRSVRGRLVAVKRLRCDGYAAMVRPHSRFARSLSRRRGRLICKALRRLALGAPGVRVTGHGAARPIASNATERGRAMNRRVEVTIVHGA